ncbi:DUF5316 family protein [Priestia koreensis]|uniref:DUF5316 family protein n=1 Tax=Priestia koreensis TaxID=284581 RepID=UPI00345A4ED1
MRGHPFYFLPVLIYTHFAHTLYTIKKAKLRIKRWDITMSMLLIIGAMSVIVSGILIGAWVSGNGHRGNFYSETPEHQHIRIKAGIYTGIIGVICLIIASCLYYIR